MCGSEICLSCGSNAKVLLDVNVYTFCIRLPSETRFRFVTVWITVNAREDTANAFVMKLIDRLNTIAAQAMAGYSGSSSAQTMSPN